MRCEVFKFYRFKVGFWVHNTGKHHEHRRCLRVYFSFVHTNFHRLNWGSGLFRVYQNHEYIFFIVIMILYLWMWDRCVRMSVCMHSYPKPHTLARISIQFSLIFLANWQLFNRIFSMCFHLNYSHLTINEIMDIYYCCQQSAHQNIIFLSP